MDETLSNAVDNLRRRMKLRSSLVPLPLFEYPVAQCLTGPPKLGSIADLGSQGYGPA
jgi:hypothetical protein